MELMKFFGRGTAGLALVLAGVLLAGCQTDRGNGGSYGGDPLKETTAPASGPANPSGTLMHVGDEITVSFSDVAQSILPIDDTIKEDGSITLVYNQKFQAAGKTAGVLQEEIRQRYVPQYFKFLTVTVKTQERFYFVGGEVRAPGRQIYTGSMTLLGAIDTAGGFTDFAKRSKVQVTREGGKSFNVDATKALTHPELNVPIFPGDRVFVHKRMW